MDLGVFRCFLVGTEKGEHIGCKSKSTGQFFFVQVVFRQKLMQMEGLEAWEYQNGASIDVLYTMVGSNCRLVL